MNNIQNYTEASDHYAVPLHSESQVIYIVRQQGVYWKEIVGIFTSESEAIDKCKMMASLDRDTYHAWIVTKHKIGEFIDVDRTKDFQSASASESIVFSINGRTSNQLSDK